MVDDTVLLTESYGPGGVLLRLGEEDEPTEPTVVWKGPRRGKSLECHWNTPAPVLANGRLYLRGPDQVVVLDLSPPAEAGPEGRETR